MEQPVTDNRRSLTLKRVLICSAVVGVVVYAASRVSDTRREKARDNCFARFRNVHEALVLYRADADGFSPTYARWEVMKPEAKLAKYDGGKSLACPYDPRFNIISLRLSSGGVVGTVPYRGTRTISLMSMFGTEDASVITTCENHLKHKFRLTIPGSPPSFYQDAPTGGSYVALLRNGSAKLVPYNAKFESWICKGGVCLRPKDRPSSWIAYGSVSIFDFEPSPPKFER